MNRTRIEQLAWLLGRGALVTLLGLQMRCGDEAAPRTAAGGTSGAAEAGARAAGGSVSAGAAADAGGAPAEAAGAGHGSAGLGGATEGGATRNVRFRKVTLHREFHCEGASFGDLDRDGVLDVIAGPDWYPGPDFAEPHPLWPRLAFDPKGYSDCFFQFSYDFDQDGWLDVLTVGFPGQSALWYRNPGGAGAWEPHEVTPVVDGESPDFTDLDGDGTPELVFMQGGRLGYATPDLANPTAPWAFRPLSAARSYGAFTHGLGVGDLNGDGQLDVLEATGFYTQPSRVTGALWPRTEQAFGLGGGQLLVEDLDGDGDADVASTLAAHGYGLGWYEQTATASFIEHVLVPNEATAEGEPILHEPHALALADIDGDGLSDLVTGERFWGHVPEEPDFGAPAHLYWFRRELTAQGPRFTPTLIDADSGIGTQLTVGDLDEDGRPDIVIANKKGAFVFLQTNE